MLPRFHIGIDQVPLSTGLVFGLPDGASRHIQVLRLQPGALVQLFDGRGHEWQATVTEMGRKVVTVAIREPLHHNRELPVQVTLAIGMPANDRMDALVEKAAELGVFAIQPLICERSVLRLDGERAAKKVAHWQAVAISACEQCGRATVPKVHEVRSLSSWLHMQVHATGASESPSVHRGVLSLREAATLSTWIAACSPADGRRTASPVVGYVFLSGPEGGLSPTEEQAALDSGWAAVSLGPRVLRADTAPLAALSVIGAAYEL